MDDPRWVEVSLRVSAEQAEAVAEVLSRFLPNGVVVEQYAIPNDRDETNPTEPDVKVFGYFLADASLPDKQRKLEEALWHLSQIQELPSPTYQPIQDEDWMAAWKKQYRPIEIGKKLVILPAWIKKETPDRIPILINPSMAFGTGTHPSTQLCLLLMEEAIQPGYTVMDIGCGSGILSVAAIKLGASQVLAVDIDPAAIISTRENADNNQVTSQLDVQAGSVAEILEGQFCMKDARVVLVNILASTITMLMTSGLVELVQADGELILAGILENQVDEIRTLAREKGLGVVKQVNSADWSALVLVKK